MRDVIIGTVVDGSLAGRRARHAGAPAFYGRKVRPEIQQLLRRQKPVHEVIASLFAAAQRSLCYQHLAVLAEARMLLAKVFIPGTYVRKMEQLRRAANCRMAQITQVDPALSVQARLADGWELNASDRKLLSQMRAFHDYVVATLVQVKGHEDPIHMLLFDWVIWLIINVRYPVEHACAVFSAFDAARCRLKRSIKHCQPAYDVLLAEMQQHQQVCQLERRAAALAARNAQAASQADSLRGTAHMEKERAKLKTARKPATSALNKQSGGFLGSFYGGREEKRN